MSWKPFAVIASLAVAAPAVASTGEHAVSEKVDLTLVKKTGKKLQHKGRATGTVDGPVTSTIIISHSLVMRGTVTIKAREGKVLLKVDGRARSIKTRARFDGTAEISGGTGKYAGAIGSGKFHGIVNRHTWHVTLDATGSYHF